MCLEINPEQTNGDLNTSYVKIAIVMSQYYITAPRASHTVRYYKYFRIENKNCHPHPHHHHVLLSNVMMMRAVASTCLSDSSSLTGGYSHHDHRHDCFLSQPGTKHPLIWEEIMIKLRVTKYILKHYIFRDFLSGRQLTPIIRSKIDYYSEDKGWVIKLSNCLSWTLWPTQQIVLNTELWSLSWKWELIWCLYLFLQLIVKTILLDTHIITPGDYRATTWRGQIFDVVATGWHPA